MSVAGTFRFAMPDLPEQVLDLSDAGIVLFGHACIGATTLQANIKVSAEPRMVLQTDPDYPDEGPFEHRVAPTFHTEWLDVQRTALASRDAGTVDGVGFDYDADFDVGGGPAESPGGLYQDGYAQFQRANCRLRHKGLGRYDIQAEGTAEFGWVFAVEAEAAFERIVFRHGTPAAQEKPSPEVEAEFDALFDRDAFDCSWQKRGPADSGWYDFIATVKGTTP